MLIAFLLLVACMIVMIVASLIWPEPLKKEAGLLVWTNWREPLRGSAGGRGLGNYRVLTVVVLATFVMLYLIFR